MMKNVPDLGVIFVLTMFFWLIFYLIYLLFERINYPFAELGYAFVSALVLDYFLSKKGKELEEETKEKHRIISYWENKEIERQ